MISWQYHSYILEHDDDVVAILNKFGEKGWEVVTFIPFHARTRVLFKRPIEPTTGESK